MNSLDLIAARSYTDERGQGVVVTTLGLHAHGRTSFSNEGTAKRYSPFGRASVGLLIFIVIACLASVGAMSAKGIGGQSGRNTALNIAQSQYTSISEYLDVDAPWPKFQQNAYNTGQGIGSGANGLEKWTFQTGDVVYSSPVIGSDGTVYFGSNDGCLYAVAPDGNMKWSFAADSGITSAPLIGKGRIFVASDETVYALNSSTGAVEWSYFPTNSAGYNDLAVSPKGLLLDLTGSGLYAFNSVTGKLVWTFGLADAGSWSSAAVDPVRGTIYVGTSLGLYALDEEGKKEWQFPSSYTPELTFTSGPAVGKNGLIYMGGRSFRGAFMEAIKDNHEGTYTLEWQDIGLGGAPSPPAIGPNETLYFGDDYHTFYSLDAETGGLKWTFRIGSQIHAAPAIGADGTVYVFSDFGIFYALNPSGREDWEVQLVSTYDPSLGPATSPAIAADGTIYVGGADGQLHAVGTDTLADFFVAPSAVMGGYDSDGVIRLAGPAGPVNGSGGPGGNTVMLQSNNPNVIVPPTVDVPPGKNAISFPIPTIEVYSQHTATITATLGSKSLSATLVLEPEPPQLARFFVSPTSVVGGKESDGVVQLLYGAPVGGVTIKISCKSPYVTVPPTVFVPGGQKGASFTIHTSKVSAPESAILTANLTSTLFLRTTLTLTP